MSAVNEAVMEEGDVPRELDDTFITGINNVQGGDSEAKFEQTGAAPAPNTTTGVSQAETELQRDSFQEEMERLDREIQETERVMREYEENAEYISAEKMRRRLEALQAQQKSTTLNETERVQQDDIKLFYQMVTQHQEHFERVWQKKLVEHKLRADDLIDSIKWKHDQQQRELFNLLQQKRMPKFSMELLNLRKKQVALAKGKKYLQAEKVKRKADLLQASELDRMRRQAAAENQMRFKALLKRQQADREALSAKLQLEKRCLTEMKAQDFQRLKKRLKNAEAELRKTHVRQRMETSRRVGKRLMSSSMTKTGGGRGAAGRRAGGGHTARRKPSARELIQKGRGGKSAAR